MDWKKTGISFSFGILGSSVCLIVKGFVYQWNFDSASGLIADIFFFPFLVYMIIGIVLMLLKYGRYDRIQYKRESKEAVRLGYEPKYKTFKEFILNKERSSSKLHPVLIPCAVFLFVSVISSLIYYLK